MSDPQEPPPEEPIRDADTVFLIAVATELALALVALLLGWLLGPDPRLLVPALDELRALASGVGWGLLAALPILAAMLLAERLPLPGMRELNDAADRLIVPTLGRLNWAELAVVSIAAGVGEEMLFRGWLQVALTGPPETASLGTTAVGVALASLAFGLAHPISRAYVAFATGVGLYLGGLLAWSGNLLVPITAHAGYDFVALLYLIHEAKQEKSAGPEDGT